MVFVVAIWVLIKGIEWSCKAIKHTHNILQFEEWVCDQYCKLPGKLGSASLADLGPGLTKFNGLLP